jgi:ubiquinone/menaquinone biosynthesis C-methylase UbiE
MISDINVKLKHEHYLDKWLSLYELDSYKIWLFRGLIKILRKYIHRGRVLELGCARGYFVEMLESAGYQAVGIDISYTALSRGVKNIDKVETDAESLPFSSNSFDAIVAIHVLEHLPSPYKALLECSRVLKRRGLLLAITPDKESLIAKLAFHMVRYTALKNPYHVSLMNRKELIKLIRKLDFSEFTVLPFHNGFLGMPFIKFIPIPISTNILIPFSHHQLLIALK